MVGFQKISLAFTLLSMWCQHKAAWAMQQPPEIGQAPESWECQVSLACQALPMASQVQWDYPDLGNRDTWALWERMSISDHRGSHSKYWVGHPWTCFPYVLTTPFAMQCVSGCQLLSCSSGILHCFPCFTHLFYLEKNLMISEELIQTFLYFPITMKMSQSKKEF